MLQQRPITNNRLMFSLTGLSLNEFERLLERFEPIYHEFRAKENPNRKRKYRNGTKGFLTIKQKLLMVLVHFKCYPTYDLLGWLFGLERTRAFRWVKILTPILETVLERNMVLPARTINTKEEFLKLFPDLEVFIDGTERPIHKFDNPKSGKRHYSGKKKVHTKKNITLSTKSKRVNYLTKTSYGRRHDKYHADKNSVFEDLPPEIQSWVDTGFQGSQKKHEKTNIPKKSTKKNPLTQDQKDENKLISSYRVVAEHALAGIKRMQSCVQTIRSHIDEKADKLILIATGIWNFHLDFRS
jgi:hypothetical protein